MTVCAVQSRRYWFHNYYCSQQWAISNHLQNDHSAAYNSYIQLDSVSTELSHTLINPRKQVFNTSAGTWPLSWLTSLSSGMPYTNHSIFSGKLGWGCWRFWQYETTRIASPRHLCLRVRTRPWTIYIEYILPCNIRMSLWTWTISR